MLGTLPPLHIAELQSSYNICVRVDADRHEFNSGRRSIPKDRIGSIFIFLSNFSLSWVVRWALYASIRDMI